MRLRDIAIVLAALIVPSCTDNKSPLAPTTIAAPSPPPVAPPLPTNVPGVLSVAMPIDGGDVSNIAFGLAPFGYHDAAHAQDGHTGWDIEYRIGGIIRAAAAGVVLGVSADPAVGGRSIVQIEHLVGAHYYRTVYTNVADVRSTVVTNAAVVAGQPIGTAGTVSQFAGRIPLVYAMTHFQLDDFEYYRDIPNPNAVSAEPFLSAPAKALLDALWSRAAFGHELVEPFVTNPRDLSFPASRTWMRAGGDGPAGIRFTRQTGRDAVYEYALLAESGTAIESGTVSLNATNRPFPTIDLYSPTASRLGLYDIVSNEMRLALGNPGSSRPNDLAAASLYRTSR